MIESLLTSDNSQRARQLSLFGASELFRKEVLSYQRLGKSHAETFAFQHPAAIVLAATVPDYPQHTASALLAHAIWQDRIVEFEHCYHA